MKESSSGKSERNRDNMWKEAMFRSVLKYELLRSRYVLAIPEPDLGNDLWLSQLDGPATITRAQIKSAYAGVPRGKGITRYLVNVKRPVFEEGLKNGCIYFIGLYDTTEPRQFHIGCIPTKLLRDAWNHKNKLLRRRMGGGKIPRIMLDFLVSSDRQYFFGVTARQPVTKYFNLQNLPAICSGDEVK